MDHAIAEGDPVTKQQLLAPIPSGHVVRFQVKCAATLQAGRNVFLFATVCHLLRHRPRQNRPFSKASGSAAVCGMTDGASMKDNTRNAAALLSGKGIPTGKLRWVFRVTLDCTHYIQRIWHVILFCAFPWHAILRKNLRSLDLVSATK